MCSPPGTIGPVAAGGGSPGDGRSRTGSSGALESIACSPYPPARVDGNVPIMNVTKTLQRWICESCGYIYDPDDGDPDGGIPAGTAFEDIPDTWFCPVCGARKRDFVIYED